MRPIRDFFSQSLKTQTAQDTVVVFIGQFFNTTVSALFFILLARVLGPAQLGVYSAVTALILIITDTVDLAINSSIIRFNQLPEKEQFNKFAFFLKLILGSLFSIFIFLASKPISFLLQRDLNSSLKVAAFLILVIFLYRFPKAILQAQKNFKTDALLDGGLSLLRLIFSILVIYFYQLTVNKALYIQIIVTFIMMILGFKQVGLSFIGEKIKANLQNKFFSFQSWLTLAFILASIHSRIDNFLLMRFAGPEKLGFYQAGYRFFMPIIQFASVLSAVFAPRFASFTNEQEVKNYLRKTACLTGFFGFLILNLILLLPFFIRFFYGDDYLPAVIPTQILVVGFAFFIFAVPFNSCIIYRKEATKFFALLNFWQLFLIIGLDLLLIPSLGVIGAALALTVSLVIANLASVFWVIKK